MRHVVHISGGRGSSGGIGGICHQVVAIGYFMHISGGSGGMRVTHISGGSSGIHGTHISNDSRGMYGTYISGAVVLCVIYISGDRVSIFHTYFWWH